MSEDWQKVKELFHAAIEREPLKRPGFLIQACSGDEALRREVESLIAAHEKPGSFVDAPAYELAADLLRDDRPGARVGQQISHYEVLGKLGAGGMGEVHLALDTRLNRKVAIKLLPAEFTSNAERVRRFEQEARAASALNHPNIMTVHEIGEVEAAALHRHRIYRRRNFATADGERATRAHQVERGAGDGGAGGRCAPGRARRWDHPSRHQARECHGAPAWAGEGARLRSGKAEQTVRPILGCLRWTS